MAASQRITLEVQFNSAAAQKDVQNLNKSIRDTGKAGVEAGAEASSGFAKISASVESVGEDITRLGNAFAAAGIAKGLKELIGLGNDLSRATRGIEEFAGGAEALKELREYTKSTGAGFDEMVTALNKMVRLGVPIDEAIRRIKNLDDALAAAHLPVSTLKEALEAIDKLVVSPKVSGKQLKGLSDELGIPLFQKMLEVTGKSASEVNSEMKEFSGPLAAKMITTLIGMNVHGRAANESITDLARQQNKLKDAVGEVALSLNQNFGKAIGNVLSLVTHLVEGVNELVIAIGKLPPVLKDSLVYIASTALAVKSITSIFRLVRFGLGIGAPAAAGVGAVAAGEAAVAAGTAGALAGSSLSGYGALGILGTTGTATVGVPAAAAAATTSLTALAVAAGGIAAAFGAITLAIINYTRDIKDVNKDFYSDYETARRRPGAGAGLYGVYTRAGADPVELAMMEEATRNRRYANLPTNRQERAAYRQMAQAFSSPAYIQGAGGLPLFFPAGASPAEAAQARAEYEQARQENVVKMREETENAKREVLAAQAELARVGKEAILGIPFEFEADVSRVKKNADAIAQYRIKANLKVDVELAKAEEERKKDELKNAEEVARATHQLTVAQAEARYGEDTISGRQRVAEARAKAYEQDLEAVKKLEQDRIAERTKVLAEGTFHDRMITLDAAKLTNDQLTQAFREMQAERDRIYEKGEQEKKDKAIQYDIAIAKHRIDVEKETQNLLLEMAKKRIEDETNLAVAALTQVSAYRTTAAELRRPRNLEERLGQIRDIEAEQVYFTRKQVELQKQANLDYVEWFKDTHTKAVEQAQELTDEARRQNEILDIQSNTRVQEARFERWRQTNEAILADQQEMYGQLLSFTDQFWNALTDRSHSVWQNIGNAIKSAFSNALKGFVTSRLAGFLQETFGGGHVEFTGNWLDRLLGRKPYFEGSKEAMPALAMQQAGASLTYSGVALYNAANNLDLAANALIAAANQQMLASGDTPGGPRLVAGGSGIGGIIHDDGQGDAQRMMDDLSTMPTYDIANLPRTTPLPSVLSTIGMPGMPRTTRLGGFLGSLKKIWSGIKGSFDIGKPIGGVDWSQATIWQKAGAILKSTGMANIMALAGGALLMGGLGAKTGAGQLTQTAIGGALLGASVGSQIAKNLPGLGFGIGKGAIAGTGAGLVAFGMKRGGLTGLGSSIAGGAMLGATIGSIIPGVGTLIGAAVGAAAGAVAGAIRMLVPGFLSQVRDRIFQAYHVIIPDQGVLQSIADIINQKYGGKISTGIYSTEVQEIVRAYAISSGQTHAALPRPMYPATFAQSATGGLQLQPVYSSGQLVASPYTGATTTQYAQALTPAPPLYLQLNPGQANALLEGRVVNAIASNPGAVGAANTTAAVTGVNRTRQSSALLEPLTVTR